MRWFLFCILCVNVPISVLCSCRRNGKFLIDILKCMTTAIQDLDNGNISSLLDFEKHVANTYVADTTSYAVNSLVTFLYRMPLFYSSFTGLTIYANKRQISTERIPDTIVTTQLPRELPIKAFSKLAVAMVSLPPKAASVLMNSSDYLYNNRLLGLSVEGYHVSGLKEMVNMSMNVSTNLSTTHRPQCVFLNDSTRTFDTDGCFTQWEPEQSHIVCSCNHLTFFGVLMISNKETTQVSETDQKNLTYITFIGCSISLCALLVAVLLFVTNRRVRSDVSMKVHVNLAIALLLLNIHFLPNAAVGIWEFSWSSRWLCFYIAIGLHFSLLASFCWMAVEGFHLYLLMVKIYNIYIKKYLLKVSVVGWGVPVVVVAILLIIDIDVYGEVTVGMSNSTQICFVRDDISKTVTIMGLFGLMFLFNLILLIVTVRNIVRMRKRKQFGSNHCKQALKDICTLLGLVALLGTTWGLIFFSYGEITTIGLYAFSILNPLQGLFILVWFVMSLLKLKKASSTSTVTQTSHSIGAPVNHKSS